VCHRRHPSEIRPSIDLHCHLLPAIDDGARDLDDAIAMAQQAEADEIAAICATPHIRHDHDVRIGELVWRRAELVEALAEVGCATAVLPGAEVAVSALDGLSDSELSVVSLGGGRRWILLEPDPGPLDDRLDGAVMRLHDRGFRALIAHPERHPSPDMFGRLGSLVGEGALVQATADLLVRNPTRSGMLALAQHGLIHVLGSDAHSSRAGRPLVLSAALDALAEISPIASHLDWISHVAPTAIAAGEELTPPF
jgi:protein-tyrosine phosphatase